MDKLVRDQAEGLRRLLRRHAPRVVAIAGGTPRGGQTSVAVELAAALAHQGRDVLLLDETGHACAALGLASHHHLDDVLAGEMPLSMAQTRLRDGLAVLPAEAHKMTGELSAQWPALLGATAPDIVLIDAAASPAAPLSPLACHAQDVMVVLTPSAESITGAYAWIKRAHLTHAIPRFRLLVNRAGESEATVMCRNLAGTASRYLAVALELAGCVPVDRQLQQARQLHRCVVDAFPAAPAAVQFRQLATALMQWPAATRAPLPLARNGAAGGSGSVGLAAQPCAR